MRPNCRECLNKLEPFSNKDYILVFFAGGMQHQPSYGWIYDAYKSLSRKYKKNIKQLYVVHPSGWFKFLIWFMSTIIRYCRYPLSEFDSHKFFKKIQLFDSLEEFEQVVPIRNIFVPPLVTGHDRGLPPVAEGHNDVAMPKFRMFGAEVEQVAIEGEVPRQILKVTTQLRATGLTEEGLFRLSPDGSQVEEIRISMDRGTNMSLKSSSFRLRY